MNRIGMEASALPPVRVERALRLLPELEVLEPLRALLISVSRPDQHQVWSSSGPYLTLGKRGVNPEELRRDVGQAIQRTARHVEKLYEIYLESLECDQRGNGAGVVAALIRAGAMEQSVGRMAQAERWFQTALGVSESLTTRRPEVVALRALGGLLLHLDRANEGARHYQRALALSEAEFDQTGTVIACEGLGDAAQSQGQLTGARAWFARALRLANASQHHLSSGRLHHRLGRLAVLRGDEEDAAEQLQRAREELQTADAAREMADLLNTEGSLEADSGRTTGAATTYREALAWARRAEGQDVALEVSIRMNLARLLLSQDRLLESEEQLRRAEQLAIAGNLVRGLIQVYIHMGQLHGRQLDPAGFVFFEQAIELCRSQENSALLEARVCQAYAEFKEQLGDREEARAYQARAHDILSKLGGTGAPELSTQLDSAPA